MIAGLLHLLSWLPLIGAIVAVAVLFFLFRPLLKVCDLIPGSMWTLAVIILVGVLGSAVLQVTAARSDATTQHERADHVQGELTQLETAVTAMKKQAAAELKAAQDEVAAWQSRFNDARRAQEIKDGNAQAAIDKARRDLRAATDRNGGRLRDPWADGCRSGGQSPGAGSGAGADPGAADVPQTGRLVSAELTRRLAERELEGDRINAAYASCRADAYRVRGLAPPAAP